ncbi:hypothetical protein [Pseudoxanthomonas sp.]|uniref:hypothetical protein n=1 Tax=Pseudoxanthomonas sp. TaxID=1871049 RepID=UPI002618327D|nr:hypothetical protein [Pseudoxanthomonas sp.]WDS36168.1 MAG: hypothetical protein O8I58_18155 [Pseudoxanthomonas sp.]
MTTPREPLTPEERALAQRLAHAPGPREPGPALDALILGAAREAVAADTAPAQDAKPIEPVAPIMAAASTSPSSTPAAQSRRPRTRRWTLGLGVAASVLLAVTISWQLRPQRTTGLVYETAQAPEAAAPEAVAADNVGADANHAAAAMPPPPPVAMAPAMQPAPASPKRQPLPPPPEAPVMEAAPPPATYAPDAPAQAARAEAQAPAGIAPAPAPAPRQAKTYTPPAPPAPPAPVADAFQRYAPPPQPPAPTPMPDLGADREAVAARKVQMDQSKETQHRSERRAVLYAAPSAPTVLAYTESQAAAATAEQAAVAEDSQLPPDQWLRRIRKHRFEGHGALARASLQVFQQTHPDVAIPEDLRPLLP